MNIIDIIEKIAEPRSLAKLSKEEKKFYDNKVKEVIQKSNSDQFCLELISDLRISISATGYKKLEYGITVVGILRMGRYEIYAPFKITVIAGKLHTSSSEISIFQASKLAEIILETFCLKERE